MLLCGVQYLARGCVESFLPASSARGLKPAPPPGVIVIALWLVEVAYRTELLAGARVNHFERVIVERSGKYPLPIEIHRQMIHAAIDIGEWDPGGEFEGRRTLRDSDRRKENKSERQSQSILHVSLLVECQMPGTWNAAPKKSQSSGNIGPFTSPLFALTPALSELWLRRFPAPAWKDLDISRESDVALRLTATSRDKIL